MQCTKFACGHDDDVLDIQSTTYDAFGNVVSVVVEQNTTNDLTEDADSWCFDSLETAVDDDALQYIKPASTIPAKAVGLIIARLDSAQETPIFTAIPIKNEAEELLCPLYRPGCPFNGSCALSLASQVITEKRSVCVFGPTLPARAISSPHFSSSPFRKKFNLPSKHPCAPS